MNGAHPPKNPNFKNPQDVTTIAYITNFPTSMGSKDLWQLCDKHGTVTDVYIAYERVVWIEIGGLPLNAWTSKAFKKIACSWGVPLFVDEDPSENAVIG
ncbi:RNA-directed DNA polymerase, eukaryota, partial [Tanacetum coccineum]